MPFTHEDNFEPSLFDDRVCITCSTPYVKGQTFESHDEAGEQWMCKDCWVNETTMKCLAMCIKINNITKRAAQEAADDLVADVYG